MQVHISPIVFNAYSIANSGLCDCVAYSQIQSQLSNEHFMYSPKKFNFANPRLTQLLCRVEPADNILLRLRAHTNKHTNQVALV